MWDWLKLIYEFVIKFLFLRRKKKQEEEAIKRKEYEQQLERKDAVEKEIMDNVQRVEQPKLDSSINSQDPLGIDRWNSGR